MEGSSDKGTTESRTQRVSKKVGHCNREEGGRL